MELTVENTEHMKQYIDKLNELGNTEHMDQIGKIMAEGIMPIIPTDTGTMAKAYTSTVTRNEVTVSWENGTPYTRYQFYGVVMGPNKAVWAQGANKNGAAGVHAGWVSPQKPKELTDRLIGKKHDITLRDGRVIHIRGYKNPKSTSEWTTEARDTPEVWYPIRFKIGRYLYETWKESNK